MLNHNLVLGSKSWKVKSNEMCIYGDAKPDRSEKNLKLISIKLLILICTGMLLYFLKKNYYLNKKL